MKYDATPSNTEILPQRAFPKMRRTRSRTRAFSFAFSFSSSLSFSLTFAFAASILWAVGGAFHSVAQSPIPSSQTPTVLAQTSSDEQIPPRSSTARRTLRLEMHWTPKAQFAGYIMAYEKNFYRDAGLPPIEMVWDNQGSDSFESLVNRDADFCTGWLADGLAARNRGLAIVELAQCFDKPSQLLIVRADSEILTPQDIQGHRIGVWVGNHSVLLRRFLETQNIQAEVIPQSVSLVPFLRGAIDVCPAMYYNEYNRLIEAGLSPEQLRTFALADYGLGFPEDAMFASESMWRENPESCRKFVWATLRGWEYAFDPEHEQETIEAILRHANGTTHSNRNHQRWMLRAIRPQFPESRDAWGRLSPDVYQRLMEELAAMGEITTSVPFETFYVGDKILRTPPPESRTTRFTKSESGSQGGRR